jgi:hypothetical protein
MAVYDPEDFIRALADALRGSVPRHVHGNTLEALKRCHDLMARSLPHIKNKELQKEMAIYANILEQYFYNGELEHYPTKADIWLNQSKNITNDDLEEMLRRKGINIPKAKRPTFKPKRRGRK